jgi:hypothetical protein
MEPNCLVSALLFSGFWKNKCLIVFSCCAPIYNLYFASFGKIYGVAAERPAAINKGVKKLKPEEIFSWVIIFKSNIDIK